MASLPKITLPTPLIFEIDSENVELHGHSAPFGERFLASSWTDGKLSTTIFEGPQIRGSLIIEDVGNICIHPTKEWLAVASRTTKNVTFYNFSGEKLHQFNLPSHELEEDFPIPHAVSFDDQGGFIYVGRTVETVSEGDGHQLVLWSTNDLKDYGDLSKAADRTEISFGYNYAFQPASTQGFQNLACFGHGMLYVNFSTASGKIDRYGAFEPGDSSVWIQKFNFAEPSSTISSYRVEYAKIGNPVLWPNQNSGPNGVFFYTDLVHAILTSDQGNIYLLHTRSMISSLSRSSEPKILAKPNSQALRRFHNWAVARQDRFC